MQLNQIIHELHRKYDRTFIFIEVGGREVLAYVNSLTVVGDGNDAYGEIVLSTKEYGKLSYKIPTTQQLIFRVPRTTTFQLGKHACFVTRAPARQWQRGLCAHNTLITNLSAYILNGGAGAASNILFGLESVQAAYDGQTYPNVESGIEAMLKGDACSVALPDSWAMTLSPTKEQDGFPLLYKMLTVARVSKEGRLLRMCQPHFANAVNLVLEGK